MKSILQNSNDFIMQMKAPADQRKFGCGSFKSCGVFIAASLHAAFARQVVAGEQAVWWFESPSHRIVSFVPCVFKFCQEDLALGILMGCNFCPTLSGWGADAW